MFDSRLAERAWAKAGTDDFLRGAVCYYKGFGRTDGDTPKDVTRMFHNAIRQWVATGNQTEIDRAMLKLGRARKRPQTQSKPIAEEIARHWANLDLSTFNSTADEKKDEGTIAVSPLKTAMIPVSELRLNTQRHPHVFDNDTISRMRKVYDILYVQQQWDTFEEFVDGFYFDMNPYGEVVIWERIAKCYQYAVRAFNVKDDGLEQVYTQLLMFSNNRPENIYHLPDEAFNVLTGLWMENEELMAMIDNGDFDART